jgi:hypothetical protein
VHFGSSNACYAWTEGPQGLTRASEADNARYLVLSRSAVPLVDETFGAIEATRLVADKQAIGELRDVHAAGYPNSLGLAGHHRFFHTTADDVKSTGPEILEPVARAFADAVRKIGVRGAAAFR